MYGYYRDRETRKSKPMTKIEEVKRIIQRKKDDMEREWNNSSLCVGYRVDCRTKTRWFEGILSIIEEVENQ